MTNLEVRAELADAAPPEAVEGQDEGKPVIFDHPPYRPNIAPHVKRGTSLGWPLAVNVGPGMPVGCRNTILLQIAPFERMTELLHPTAPHALRRPARSRLRPENAGISYIAFSLRIPPPSSTAVVLRQLTFVVDERVPISSRPTSLRSLSCRRTPRMRGARDRPSS